MHVPNSSMEWRKRALSPINLGMSKSDEVLVTGASGGVGSVAVSILSHAGLSLGWKNLLRGTPQWHQQ